MTVAVSSSTVEALLHQEHGVAFGDVERKRLSRQISSAVRWYRTWKKLDSKPVSKKVYSRIAAIEKACQQISKLLPNNADEKRPEDTLDPLVRGLIGDYLPPYEGFVDSAGRERHEASLCGMAFAAKALAEGCRRVTELASENEGALYRMRRKASADLVARVLPKLYTQWTGKKAGAGRPHAADSETSNTADGPFIRFAMAAVYDMRQMEPSITAYTADSLASEFNRRDQSRRGKQASKRKPTKPRYGVA